MVRSLVLKWMCKEVPEWKATEARKWQVSSGLERCGTGPLFLSNDVRQEISRSVPSDARLESLSTC